MVSSTATQNAAAPNPGDAAKKNAFLVTPITVPKPALS
jgi:hypothetical protein